MISVSHPEPDDSEFVEVDPTERYGRYNEILGKGASKTVYRAFDEYEGIEVAWNKVKLYDFLQSPEDLERLYCEIHLLKTLKHPNIMKFYTSWVDTANRNINFVTEVFTSGTLRQYRLKHRRVNIRAVKNWCRQILRGLLYLHSHNPPVIHRDLKCDNIFINGNQGEVKIGDLGLAAILRNSHAAHCVGTPEFMAPEVYEEDYNELVDIYSFGMCILEMVTFEYPYSECTHPAQIYKKVISGKKPDALYKVKNREVRQFIEKCLATVSLRLSARELLNDPFLQIDDRKMDLTPVMCDGELGCVDSLLRQPFLKLDCEGSTYNSSNLTGYSNGFVSEVENGYSNGFVSEVQSGYSNGFESEVQNGWEYPQTDIESGIKLFDYNDDDDGDDDHYHDHHHGGTYEQLGVSIKGKRKEDGSIFLRLRISENEGRIRNIYFPFDIESDTALIVATEMVGELDITDQDVTKIADMIDGEIASLVPDWKTGLGIEETPRISNVNFCNNCAVKHTSNSSLVNFLSNDPGTKDLKTLHCLGNGCASMHGRFEEITYQVGSPQLHVLSGANNPTFSCQSNGFHVAKGQDQHESLDCCSLGSGQNHSIEEQEIMNQPVSAQDKKEIAISNKQPSKTLHKFLSAPLDLEEILPTSLDFPDEYDHEMQQELIWFRTKYQMDMIELRNQQLAHKPKPSKVTSGSGTSKQKTKNGILSSLATKLKRKTYQQHFPKSSDKNVHICMNALSLRTASVRYPKLP